MVSEKAIKFLEEEISRYEGMAMASNAFKTEFSRNAGLLKEILAEVRNKEEHHMNDFDYENLQKKITARSAHNKVTHSGCTMPSDYLTPAQRRKLDGAVSSVKLGKPMRWEEFKKLPTDSMKSEYIKDLRDNHGATATYIARMFGVCNPTAFAEIKRLGIKFPQCRPSREQREGWNKFCEQTEEEPTERVLDAVKPKRLADDFRPVRDGRPQTMSMSFKGKPSEEYLSTIWNLCDGREATVTITVEVEK